MFPDNICQNIDILVVINIQKKNFGFHSNRKTQGQKHQVNNLYLKYQVCQIKLRYLHTFLQFRPFFHEPHRKSHRPRYRIAFHRCSHKIFVKQSVLLLKSYGLKVNYIVEPSMRLMNLIIWAAAASWCIHWSAGDQPVISRLKGYI